MSATVHPLKGDRLLAGSPIDKQAALETLDHVRGLIEVGEVQSLAVVTVTPGLRHGVWWIGNSAALIGVATMLSDALVRQANDR